jgi:hypothetical protein
MTSKYIGSTEGLIDWDEIVTICKNSQDGDFNSVKTVVDRSEGSWQDNPELLGSYREVIELWHNAGYDLEQIEWYDYYPGTHFDIEVQNKFAELVNVIPRRTFVSEVYPGRCVPYHWDVEDNEKEWLEQGDLVRYACFMDKPQFGHVFILEDECFYNAKQHDVIEWANYRDWHAGTNCGSEPWYLFHMLGTPK